MPSRWAKTGTRASRCTRPTSPLPPRGTITSICSTARSISLTISRSRVGTSWIAASGRPACRRPCDQTGMDRGRGMEAFRPAAQDHRIARLQAQRARHPPSHWGGFRRSRRSRPAACARGGCAARSACPIRRSPRPPGRSARPPRAARRRCRAPGPSSSRRRSIIAGDRPFSSAIDLILGIGVDDLPPPRPDRLGRPDQRRVLALGAGKGQLRRRRPRRAPICCIRPSSAPSIARSRFRPSILPENYPQRSSASADSSPSGARLARQITMSSRWISAARPA